MATVADMENLFTLAIIYDDVNTISEIIKTEHDFSFLQNIIPFYALFVQSCVEVFGEDCLDEDSMKLIRDTRNHLKDFSDRFGKTKRLIIKTDNVNDDAFKSKLKFNFLKDWNIYYNLGTFWNEEKHLVGNSQYISEIFGFENLFDENVKVKSYNLGFQLSVCISSIQKGLCAKPNEDKLVRKKINIKNPYYFDLNTNMLYKLVNNTLSKELNLLFLHLLCSLNFAKYELDELFENPNMWIFRVKYITVYYSLLALKKLKMSVENNNEHFIDLKEIEVLISESSCLFKSNFRNCMMHYSLVDRNVLNLKYLKCPLFGLVESCFNGKDFYTYYNDLNEFADKIIVYLEKQLGIKDVKLKKF